jgi:hypothetical protein
MSFNLVENTRNILNPQLKHVNFKIGSEVPRGINLRFKEIGIAIYMNIYINGCNRLKRTKFQNNDVTINYSCKSTAAVFVNLTAIFRNVMHSAS